MRLTVTTRYRIIVRLLFCFLFSFSLTRHHGTDADRRAGDGRVQRGEGAHQRRSRTAVVDVVDVVVVVAVVVGAVVVVLVVVVVVVVVVVGGGR